MCQCYIIGGPFIAEDPDCPVHGRASQGRSDSIEEIVEQAVRGEISASVAAELIQELYY